MTDPTPPVKAAPKPKKPRAPKVPRRPESLRTDMRLTAWVGAAILAADQALKYWVVHGLNLDQVRSIDVLPPWLNLRMAWNQGINFGLFSSDENIMRWVLIAIALAVCAWVWLWLARSRAGMVARVSAGLLIGGALGNVIDRIAYGAVADFLNMSLPGWQNPYSFNVADIAIFLGAIGLVLMPAEPAPAAPPPRKARSPRKTTPPVTTPPEDATPRDGSENAR